MYTHVQGVQTDKSMHSSAQTKEQSITVAYTLLLPDRGRAEAWCFQTQDQKQVLQFPCTIRSTYHAVH